MNSITPTGTAGSTNPSPDLENQLVNAEMLLELLFAEGCRPTTRWLRNLQRLRTIPHVKIGKLVFFCPAQVRKALETHRISFNA